MSVTIPAHILDEIFETEGTCEGWTFFATEETGHGRWRSRHRLVVYRDGDINNLYACSYELGLTENQDPTIPWQEAEFVQVHPVEAVFIQKVTFRWKGVDAG